MHMDELIKRLVEENLHPTHMELINESHKHADHAGDNGSGQTHYKLIIVSEAYKGLSRIECHRITMVILDEAFKDGLHALSLKLSTP
ncbi:MAG TPA: BolA family protein [Alphaproteobacteria bacterium]|nr:BolA family transcriptional regulator [Alphaproteobacteria bacterium]USO06389.1 MAG: BolA family transcriptional regulator [Rhodospirillales bacterium]HOO82515.1 BolA family protein [Alphaproteobacteria bacterium]